MPALLWKILAVALGGAVGSVLRYGVSGLAYRLLGSTFPWGTLVVNVTGCFLIGILWGLVERYPLRPSTNLLVFTGILGAFTTFSTFGLESMNLMRDGEVGAAAANVVASNVAGLFVVYLGFALARIVPAAVGVEAER